MVPPDLTQMSPQSFSWLAMNPEFLREMTGPCLFKISLLSLILDKLEIGDNIEWIETEGEGLENSNNSV